MNSQIRSFMAIFLSVLTFASGCKPIQPFYFYSDGEVFGKGDNSHYMDVATNIEYPDVHQPSLEEVQTANNPLTVKNSENFDMWDVSLEEVTRITLSNSMVIRELGGRITDGGSNIATAIPERLATKLGPSPGGQTTTTYDPAIVETGNGTGTGSQLSGTGVEAALAEFDAILDTSLTFQNNDRPQNFGAFAGGIFATNFIQDTHNYTAGITKIAADGTTFDVRSNTAYDNNNNGSRAAPSDWFTNLEMGVSHPLLQGRGTQLNRIAGPQTAQQAAAGVVNQIDGVIISRIRHDVQLTTFEMGVRDLMRDVEDAYWELYFAYQNLESQKVGRDSALETWKKVKALQRVGGQGGEADREAQSRAQYYQFRSQVETALTNLFRVENNLRYMMGLTHSDGRLIRPADEPTTAQVHFDWYTIHCESLARRAEIRKQKWQVKRREMELIATKNNLMPRLDLTGRYRFLGGGDDLLNSDATGIPPFSPGSNAWETLVSGDYQEWEAGVQFSMPIGFRRAMSGVRHHQLLLAQEKAVLQDMELEISHQLGHTIRDVDLNYALTQSNFNRRVAAEDEVEAVEAVYDSGRVTLDLLLDAQRRRAEAESAYYRSLVDYNRAIMRVHYRKGSLLEYNGVYLAEGPWPGKAHFDALRRSKERDAGTYINYGFTRPNVISRGTHPQYYGTDNAGLEPTPIYDGPALEEAQPLEPPMEEVIPAPEEASSDPITLQYPASSVNLVRLPEQVANADYAVPNAFDTSDANNVVELPNQEVLNRPQANSELASTIEHDNIQQVSNLQTVKKPNPLRPRFESRPLIPAAEIAPLDNEPNANYTPIEAATSPAIGQWTER